MRNFENTSSVYTLVASSIRSESGLKKLGIFNLGGRLIIFEAVWSPKATDHSNLLTCWFADCYSLCSRAEVHLGVGTKFNPLKSSCLSVSEMLTFDLLRIVLFAKSLANASFFLFVSFYILAYPFCSFAFSYSQPINLSSYFAVMTIDYCRWYFRVNDLVVLL